MYKRGKLFVISAPSGAGKTTLCARLLKDMPKLVCSVSMTTRKLRRGEKDGMDYFFTDIRAFKKRIQENYFLEYAKVFGHYYGTPRDFVERNLCQGKNVLLNIDVQGAMQIRKNFRKDSVFIFILPPSIDDLKKRLMLRKTDTEFEIKQRLKVAKRELKQLKFYDHKIINDDINEALSELKSVLIGRQTIKRRVG
ncbi:MAG: guanylate kinase [Candidatus Omnitrophica bacterium]|nr:guanylate kinase [Candidatus Omnitrophota bacterium]MBU1925166.1 guanylate kinase [Candidatus Omnitrophota bacterium]